MVNSNLKKISGIISISFLLLVFFQTAIYNLMRIDGKEVDRKLMDTTLLIWYLVIFASSITYGCLSYKNMEKFRLIASGFMLIVSIFGIAHTSLYINFINNPLMGNWSMLKWSSKLETINTFLSAISIGIASFSMAKDF